VKRILRAVILTLALAAMAPGKLLAKPGANANAVVEVRVVGNQALTAADVLADVKTRPGQPYDEDRLREDQQALMRTGRYANVVAAKTQTDQGVIVTFRVTERPLVAAIEFDGNKAFTDIELLGSLAFGPRDPIDRHKVAGGAGAIRSRYRSSGYHFVEVTLDEGTLQAKRQVIYRIVEGPKVVLKKIRFKGNDSFSARELKRVIKSRARFWPIEAGVLDAETVERDVVDLRNFYQREGFLNAQVARQLDFTPDRRAIVTFVIEEGLRFRVRKTLFEGNAVYSGEELAGELKLTSGAQYSALNLRRDLETMRRLYGEIGYVDAAVNAKTVYTDQDGMVDLAYSIREGQQFHVGRIDIRGNQTTKENVIRRVLPVRPGQLYNTVAMEDSRRRLQFDTGLFEKVTITPFGDQPGVRNALVEVTEAKTAQFLIGAGVSSNAGLLGTISYTERNFDLFAWPTWGAVKRGRAFRGGGQTFTIIAEPGTEFMRFRISWREPYLFDRPYSLGASAYLFTAGRESYDETRFGAVVSLGHRFPNRWYGEVAARVEGVHVDDLDTNAPPDVTEVAGTTPLVGLKGTLVRDRTDSRWLPSTGDRFSVSYEQITGGFNFGRATGDYHIYRTLYRDALERKHILAGRLAAGAILGDSPVFERFYGGGLGSVRGFEYRGISPRQGPQEEEVGGEYMVFLGAEYTFPLVGENLRGVLFMDSGTVETDFRLTDYRVSAGFGLRWHIPFFGPIPMNLNLGFPLNKSVEDDTQILSFSLGWVF